MVYRSLFFSDSIWEDKDSVFYVQLFIANVSFMLLVFQNIFKKYLNIATFLKDLLWSFVLKFCWAILLWAMNTDNKQVRYCFLC
jgi:hypothetical protein